MFDTQIKTAAKYRSVELRKEIGVKIKHQFTVFSKQQR